MSYPRPPVLHGQSGEATDTGFPVHVNANTAGTQVATGPCVLKSVVVGKAGSADWVTTIYDGTSTSGAMVGVCDFNAGGTYPFNCVFETGIYITIAGTTAGDLTFIVVDPAKV